jgi:hypothetical protein
MRLKEQSQKKLSKMKARHKQGNGKESSTATVGCLHENEEEHDMDGKKGTEKKNLQDSIPEAFTKHCKIITRHICHILLHFVLLISSTEKTADCLLFVCCLPVCCLLSAFCCLLIGDQIAENRTDRDLKPGTGDCRLPGKDHELFV